MDIYHFETKKGALTMVGGRGGASTMFYRSTVQGAVVSYNPLILIAPPVA